MDKNNFFALVGALVLGGMTIIFLPLIGVVFGYFVGWLVGILFPFAGNWIIHGFSLFGVDVLLSDLPSMGALFGFLSGFLMRARNKK